jgi:hypothetical protein
VPARTTEAKDDKMGPRGRPAILLGYLSQASGKFSAEYKVAPLAFWEGKDKLLKIIRTRDVKFPEQITFPIQDYRAKQLQTAFERVNPIIEPEEYANKIFGNKIEEGRQEPWPQVETDEIDAPVTDDECEK